MLGAALILFAYCAFKDLRKETAQKIITLLAFADIGTAVSLMLGKLNLFVYRSQEIESHRGIITPSSRFGHTLK